MPLNPAFVIASGLQEGFLDKTTGFPLAGGTVSFWQDNNRTVPWPIYEISGTPPNYQYNVLPNPLTLSSIGTIQDPSGNDVVPYYRILDDNGQVQLYFIEVFSNELLLQFTREGWPNAFAQGSATAPGDFTNFVPNGQFLIHSNVTNPEDPVENIIVSGQINEPITVLSQGGWTFERPSGSVSIDNVSFTRFGSYVTNPTGTPRYAVTIATSDPDSGDAFKDLRLYFKDVNKFASDTLQYRLSITAISNSSGNIPVDLILIKNFGSGGSTTTETPITTFSVSSTYGIFQTSFTFGDNSTSTIGPNDDDFIQLAFRFPVDNLFSISITDVVLMVDQGILLGFPQTPDSDYVDRSIAGFLTVPAYDSSNLYLPLVLTPEGLGYNSACVGDVVAESNFINYTNSISTVTNRLLADGSQYPTNGYSPLGIPYKRLFNNYFSDGLYPRYGTGSAFVISYQTDNLSNYLRLVTNTEGLVTDTSDGAIPTGFAFSTLIAGQSISDQFVAFSDSGQVNIYIWGTVIGQVTNISPGTSGFPTSMFRNSPDTRFIAALAPTGPGSLAGTYFSFSSTTQNWYVWFTVNGVGADPAPGGTGIKINLLSTFDAFTVSSLITDGINGKQESSITTNAGSTITPGAYWDFYTLTNNYYVWYTINGSGADPMPAGKLGIKVESLSTDTAAMILNETLIAINSQYFAVPDFRGLSLKGFNNGSSNDELASIRFSRNVVNPSFDGDTVGSFYFDIIQQHLHGITDVEHTHSYLDNEHLHPIIDKEHQHTTTAGGAGDGYSSGSPNQPVAFDSGLTGLSFTGISTTEAAQSNIEIQDSFTGIGETDYQGYNYNSVRDVYVNYAILY